MTLADIPRNDLGAVRAYYRQHKPLAGEEIHILRMLQDDPTEFDKLTSRWDVKE